MMKQILFALVATFLLFVPNAYAHTYLDSTNPTDGATVTEELKTIELNYSGKIEEGSIFKVLASDGTEMKIESITLNDGVLKGTLASPLPNDTYTVTWDSISQDGHPLSGTFSFTVNAPVSSDAADNPADVATKENPEVADEVAALETKDTTDETTVETTDAEKADDGSTWTLIIVVLIILVALAIISHYAFYRAFRKKDK